MRLNQIRDCKKITGVVRGAEPCVSLCKKIFFFFFEPSLDFKKETSNTLITACQNNITVLDSYNLLNRVPH